MTSPFDPMPIVRLRDPLGGNILGGHWAVEDGRDEVPSLQDQDDTRCIVCAAPGATCTHHPGGTEMPGARRAGAKKAVTRRPGQRETTTPPVVASTTPSAVVNAPVIEGNTGRIEEQPQTPDVIVADTQTAGSFAKVPEGQQGENVQSEVQTGLYGGVSNVAPAANADNPRGETDSAEQRFRSGSEEGAPAGYIIDAGSMATKIPVRRVEGRDDMVEAREDVHVRRQAAGSRRHIFTLLMRAGTVFPKSQLDTQVL